MFKGLPWFDGYNTKLHVYYSKDYARSFTEYIHIFDEDWTGIKEINAKIEDINLSNYPNPFGFSTNITFSNKLNLKSPFIEIMNTNGQIISVLPVKNNNNIKWNVGNNPAGIYFYRLKTNDFISETKKMILQK